VKRVIARLALSVAVFAACAVLLELGLRAFGFERPPPPPIVIWNEHEDWMLNGRRGIFVRDPDCLWVPRPDNPITRPPIGVEGSDERVNEHGFRGPAIPRERTPGTLRVATLGDSSTFGFGVVWEDTYTARLARELGHEGVACEVLNAGVVGYSAVQGRERYRHDVRPWRPDVVVAAFGAINDAVAMPVDDERKLERMRADPDDLALALRERWRTFQLAAWLGGRLDRRLDGGDDEDEPERAARVPLDAFERALRELAELVRADGAELVLLSMPRKPSAEEGWPALPGYTATVERVAREEGLALADAFTAFRTAPDAQSLFLDDYHPSPSGHARVAEILARAVLERSVARR
jgi:lysophospholipase L1-like esterase